MEIMVCFLVLESGEKFEIKSLHELLYTIKKNPIETIVTGAVDRNGNILWEKQFSEVTVMPANFGK